MSDTSHAPPCHITGTSGHVLIALGDQPPIEISASKAVVLSDMLLEAAAIARGQSAWDRD